MVPNTRLELVRLSAPASKAGVSTVPPTGHLYMAEIVRIELTP
jgi:hypothetical protein